MKLLTMLEGTASTEKQQNIKQGESNGLTNCKNRDRKM